MQAFRAEVPPMHHDRCHTMRAIDVTEQMRPAAWLFERPSRPAVTIGVGDGGNEIGMGKIAWDVIRKNIPGGATIACRVATDHLIVAGLECLQTIKEAGVNVETYSRQGDPADAILDVAEEKNADLIVVGNKGMTGAKRFLLGSVPNKVSHHAPCSVMIIRTT